MNAEVVAGRYEIQRLAGTGGMGAVYLATDRRSGGPVALKMVHGETDMEAIERFVVESRVLAQLSHPGVVRYVDHGRVDGRLFLAMEWLEGITLARRLMTTGLTVDESVGIAQRVAEALAAAHRQGVIHRDVKPGNIFLVDDDPTKVKLLDFGIARLRSGSNGVTRTGAVLGTPGYMAPEQARGDKTVDGRADLFSLGCVLFRCVTGSRPFSGEDAVAVLTKILLEEAPRATELRPGLPRALDDLLAHLLAKQPNDRPADADLVIEAIAGLGLSTDGSSARASNAAPERLTTREGPSLTTHERRVVCVLLARPPVETTVTLDDLRGAVAPHGGRLDALADGSILVTVEPTGVASDRATRCARAALALRAVAPDMPITLVAGEGMLTGRLLIGPVIDRGASLLALAGSHGQIRIDDVMAGFLDARFEVHAHAGALHLVSERHDDFTTRTLMGRPSPCVGRERELATLEGTWRECVEESVARVVLVTAPAGTGKSRLRDELLRRVLEEEVEVWTGRGDPMSAGSPFGMIIEPIRRAAGVRAGEAATDASRKLEARIREVVAPAEARRVTAFIGEIIGAPSPFATVELAAARQDPQLMGDQMRRAWEDWLAAETERRPLLLVLEDLHWGDLASVLLVDAVLRHLASRPFLVLALARPEVHALFPNLWAERTLTELRLPPLTKKASARFVREALGAGTDDATVDRIVERAEGNAFFLEEVIRAVAAGRGDELPNTVLAMAQARLERLHVEERRLLRAASVFGKSFSMAGVSALLGGDEAPTFHTDWFAELVQKEIISRRAAVQLRGELTFNHAVVREAAYSMLTAEDRTLGHRLAAEWLLREGVVEAAVLAEHFERGGDPERAGIWFRRAAEHALEGNDFAAAIRWIDRAIRSGADGEEEGALRLLACEARRWRGENELAEAAATEAMRLLPKGSAAWCDAATELATAVGGSPHPDRVIALASELEQVDPRAAPSQLLMALARVARPLFWSGRHVLGSRVLARATAVEQGATDLRPTSLAALYMARGLEARVMGDPSACLAWNERAVAESERAGDRRLGCLQRANLGFSYLEIGENEEAERTLLEALATATRLGLSRIAASAEQNLGIALMRRGALDEAARLERAAFATFDAQADKRMAGGSLIYLAAIEVALGELVEARQTAARAVELLGEIAPLRCNALGVLASIELELGNVEQGLAMAREASTLLEHLGGLEEGESTVRLAYAEALHAGGDHEGARVAIDAARSRLLDRAAKVAEPRWRETFLRGIPENERTLTLAELWVDERR